MDSFYIIFTGSATRLFKILDFAATDHKKIRAFRGLRDDIRLCLMLPFSEDLKHHAEFVSYDSVIGTEEGFL